MVVVAAIGAPTFAPDTPMNETLFLVPRGNPGLTPLQLNMQTIIDAEHRVGEVAIMTPEKAPEMLATFNRAYLDLTRMLSYLELEANSAARHGLRCCCAWQSWWSTAANDSA